MRTFHCFTTKTDLLSEHQNNQKMYCKPCLSLYYIFKLCEAQYYSVLPNITAQQYNLPQTNITEKRHPKMSFHGGRGGIRTHVPELPTN